jgi:hypothetical protein
VVVLVAWLGGGVISSFLLLTRLRCLQQDRHAHLPLTFQGRENAVCVMVNIDGCECANKFTLVHKGDGREGTDKLHYPYARWADPTECRDINVYASR